MKPLNQETEENLEIMNFLHGTTNFGFPMNGKLGSNKKIRLRDFWPIKINSNEFNRIAIRRDSLKMQELCQEKARKKSKPNRRSNSIFKQLKKEIQRKNKLLDPRRSRKRKKYEKMAKAREQWIKIAKEKRRENQKVIYFPF